MTIEDFLTACKLKGWHFTYNWVKKRLKQLEQETKHV